MMEKIVSKVAMFLLVVIVFSECNSAFAASRSLYLNSNNQSDVTSDYMGVVPSNSNYPIDYLYITGETSRGAANITIYEYSDAQSGASKKLLQNTVCAVGARMASTGMTGGTRAPLIADAGYNFVTMSLKKGAAYSPNSGYSYYIANALMSTPVDDVMGRSVMDMQTYWDNLSQACNDMELQIRQWDDGNVMSE